MADILSRLLAFPVRPVHLDGVSEEEYDQAARSFVASLRESLPNIVDDSAESAALLEQLDPSIHTLSFLLVLHLQLQAVRAMTQQIVSGDLSPGGRLWTKALLFLNTFDPVQVRYAGYEWRKVVEYVATAAQTANKPLLAICPIRDAMLKLDPSCSSFTSNHVLLSRLCLLARAYTLALPVVDKDICYFPTNTDQTYLQRSQTVLCGRHESSATFVTHSSGFSSKISHRDHLQYFLYGGMIYMGLKQWKKALHCLSVVISTPSVSGISTIMVEAYKKWLLVSLLDKGYVNPLPKATPPHAVKLYHSLARPYEALGSTFRTGDFIKLKSEAEIGQSIWRMDNNTGLVLQVLVSFERRSVLKLGSTFAAVTMTDVSQRTAVADTDPYVIERYVMSLVVQKDLHATLLHPTRESNPTMLRFWMAHTHPSGDWESSIREQLSIEQRRLNILASGIYGSDNRLELGREYVDYLRKSQKRTESNTKDGITLGQVGDKEFDLDEDMMGDLR